jgi:hypothetical protein
LKKNQTELLKIKFIKENSNDIENKIQMKLKIIETKLKTKFIKPNSARVWPAHA